MTSRQECSNGLPQEGRLIHETNRDTLWADDRTAVVETPPGQWVRVWGFLRRHSAVCARLCGRVNIINVCAVRGGTTGAVQLEQLASAITLCVGGFS